ncbi:MAG: HD domain-containing protein [Proteobacteria bacterium]|nr:HD domain-containing protein [Pseudomonadota bacterium]NOG60393.1 HD domain-containing protein [Pseudomonadota bacterium]
MGLHKLHKQQVVDPSSILSNLHNQSNLTEKLQCLLEFIKQRHCFINRIAVARYDETTDIIKTYTHATEGKNPIPLYQTRLSESKSLTEIMEQRKPRILNNMNPLRSLKSEHSKKVTELGFQSSYTVPMFQGDQFLGFVFFNSSIFNAMKQNVVTDLTVIAHLINVLIVNELSFIKTTKCLTQSVATLANYRDLETGQHLIRVSHFSRIIARNLAKEAGLSDEYVELIFTFAPLHDIGKIAVADAVLCKCGKLTDEEFIMMQSHTTQGREMIEKLQNNLELLSPQSCEILKNIIYSHHEKWDGTGYPDKISGDAIPLEARITSVADVFDALTSKRIYKDPWPVDKAIDYLMEKRGSQFDANCVLKFLENRDEIESIIDKFHETYEPGITI